jgi:hypothetical protein
MPADCPTRGKPSTIPLGRVLVAAAASAARRDASQAFLALAAACCIFVNGTARAQSPDGPVPVRPLRSLNDLPLAGDSSAITTRQMMVELARTQGNNQAYQRLAAPIRHQWDEQTAAWRQRMTLLKLGGRPDVFEQLDKAYQEQGLGAVQSLTPAQSGRADNEQLMANLVRQFLPPSRADAYLEPARFGQQDKLVWRGGSEFDRMRTWQRFLENEAPSLRKLAVKLPFRLRWIKAVSLGDYDRMRGGFPLHFWDNPQTPLPFNELPRSTLQYLFGQLNPGVPGVDLPWLAHYHVEEVAPVPVGEAEALLARLAVPEGTPPLNRIPLGRVAFFAAEVEITNVVDVKPGDPRGATSAYVRVLSAAVYRDSDLQEKLALLDINQSPAPVLVSGVAPAPVVYELGEDGMLPLLQRDQPEILKRVLWQGAISSRVQAEAAAFQEMQGKGTDWKLTWQPLTANPLRQTKAVEPLYRDWVAERSRQLPKLAQLTLDPTQAQGVGYHDDLKQREKWDQLLRGNVSNLPTLNVLYGLGEAAFEREQVNAAISGPGWSPTRNSVLTAPFTTPLEPPAAQLTVLLLLPGSAADYEVPISAALAAQVRPAPERKPRFSLPGQNLADEIRWRLIGEPKVLGIVGQHKNVAIVKFIPRSAHVLLHGQEIGRLERFPEFSKTAAAVSASTPPTASAEPAPVLASVGIGAKESTDDANNSIPPSATDPISATPDASLSPEVILVTPPPPIGGPSVPFVIATTAIVTLAAAGAVFGILRMRKPATKTIMPAISASKKREAPPS